MPDAPGRQAIPQPADTIADRPLAVHAQPLSGGPTSLRLIGVIDRGTASHLEHRLIDEARRCRIQPARLLLDLEEVTYLDRTGLDALLRVRTRLTGAFVTVELNEPTPNVIRLLHEANLDGASWIPHHDRENRGRPVPSDPSAPRSG